MKIESIQPKYTTQGIGYIVVYENKDQEFFDSFEELKEAVL
jgi:GTPase SAR1 family protein